MQDQHDSMQKKKGSHYLCRDEFIPVKQYSLHETSDNTQEPPPHQESTKQQQTMVVKQDNVDLHTTENSQLEFCQEQVFDNLHLGTDTAFFHTTDKLLNSFLLETASCITCTFYMAY